MRERVKNVVALGTDASTYSDPVTPFGDLALLTADPRGRQRIWRRRREKKEGIMRVERNGQNR